jgi:hypothetical protein
MAERTSIYWLDASSSRPNQRLDIDWCSAIGQSFLVTADDASARMQHRCERAPIARLGSAPIITKSAQEPNGMKLTPERVLYQLLTQLLPGCDHQREALGAPLLDTGLYPMRSEGIHDQGR